MPNRRRSHQKGKRGELDVAHRLGAKRTGHAFVKAPDCMTQFGAYSVKNCSIGGATIADELAKLKALAPEHHHFVVFKPRRGQWLIAETLEQHAGDHGETPIKKEMDS